MSGSSTLPGMLVIADSCLGDADEYMLVDADFDSDGLADALANTGEWISTPSRQASKCEQHIKDLTAQLAQAEALQRQLVADSQKREGQEMHMMHTEVRRMVKEELERQARETGSGKDSADIHEAVRHLEQLVHGLSDAAAQHSASDVPTLTTVPQEHTETGEEWVKVHATQQGERLELAAAVCKDIETLQAHVESVGNVCMEAVRRLSARMDTLEQSLAKHRSSEQSVSAPVEQVSGQQGQQRHQPPAYMEEVPVKVRLSMISLRMGLGLKLR